MFARKQGTDDGCKRRRESRIDWIRRRRDERREIGRKGYKVRSFQRRLPSLVQPPPLPRVLSHQRINMATREIEMDKESVARTRKRDPLKLSHPVLPFYPAIEIQVHSFGLLFLKQSLR